MHPTRLKTLLLALLLPLGLLTTSACHKDSGTSSANRNLASLSVSDGILTPAFDPAVTSYSVDLYNGTASLALKATPQENSVALVINDVAVPAGSTSTPVKLKDGVNAISIKVATPFLLGEAKTYTLSVNRHPVTTTAYVLASVNGSAVKDALLTLKDAQGHVLQDHIAVDAADGSARLGLDASKTYSVLAKGTGTAEASYDNLDPNRETTFALYCFPLGMINFPASAPIITGLQYSVDGSAWTDVSGNTIHDTAANIRYLRVTAIGKAGITPTSWSGFGIGINLDAQVSYLGGMGPMGYLENSKAILVGGQQYFESIAQFSLHITNLQANGSHYLDVVAYDVANNRSEQKVNLVVSDITSVATDPDISLLAPSQVVAQFESYGLDQGIFAKQPQSLPSVDGGVTGYAANVFFSVINNGVPPGIRGFEIFRSTDLKAWSQVFTKSYPALYTGPNQDGNYQVSLNPDPTATELTPYFYKVRAFTTNATNNQGYSLESPVIGDELLPAFNVALSSPVNESVISSLTPALVHTISNPKLFQDVDTGYYYFEIYVKDTTSGDPILEQPFRCSLSSHTFQVLDPTGNWVTETYPVFAPKLSSDQRTITVQTPAGLFNQGATYEWTIFGTSSQQAAYFITGFSAIDPNVSDSYGLAISHGSDYAHGFGASNGYFRFSTASNAQ